jgi:hypothetical protein
MVNRSTENRQEPKTYMPPIAVFLCIMVTRYSLHQSKSSSIWHCRVAVYPPRGKISFLISSYLFSQSPHTMHRQQHAMDAASKTIQPTRMSTLQIASTPRSHNLLTRINRKTAFDSPLLAQPLSSFYPFDFPSWPKVTSPPTLPDFPRTVSRSLAIATDVSDEMPTRRRQCDGSKDVTCRGLGRRLVFLPPFV